MTQNTRWLIHKKLSLLVSTALAATLLVACVTQVQGAPAFPGAQGWGRNASGGGQNPDTKILLVTSLEDSGPGTLREALMGSGRRIVVFKTGGIIDLKSSISIRNGDVTIAGQTAPGDGVILRNFPIRIGANNVIMRGLRIRNGDGDGPVGDLRDSLQIGRVAKMDEEKIRDVIVDHCSFGWSMDETAEFWYGSRNVTLSHNIFSEALWMSQHPYTVKGSPYGGNPGHGYAMLFGNGANHQITVHHNLFAHNERRNPWIKTDARIELINNVIYNWGTESIGLWNTEKGAKPSFANIIGNYLKGGVDTAHHIQIGGKSIGLGRPAPVDSKFYIHDNIGPGRSNNTEDDWSLVALGEQKAETYRVDKPLPEVASGIVPQSPHDALETVLKTAGALPRDAADKRAVEHTRTGTGRHVDKLSEVGGYPKYESGTYPKDSDNDGIPDAWELQNKLNPNDKNDATKVSAKNSGYLNIEDYINSLIP